MPIAERSIRFEGMDVHTYEGGEGLHVLMIHGSGPGTASATNWAHVMEPLSRRHHVVAMDLIGFGKSGRKAAEPYFDMDLWVRQGLSVMDELCGKGPVGIIGHSLGASIALRCAIASPRVSVLVLQGPLGAQRTLNEAIALSWQAPRTEAEFRDLYKRTIRIEKPLSDEFVRERMALIRKDGYDAYFNAMFAGDKQRYIDRSLIAGSQLDAITCPVTIINGENDTCVPFNEGAVALADAIPHADLVRVSGAGHPVSFEQPAKFLGYVNVALAQLTAS